MEGTACTVFLIRYTGKTPLFVNDFGLGCVSADAGNSVKAAGLCLVALGNGNNLTVSRLKTEAELAGFVGIHFVLGVLELFRLAYGLILNRCICVCFQALDSAETSGL